MGKASTVNKNKWNAKNYDSIKLVVKKGQKEQIRAYAASKSLSLNGYITELISKDMGELLTEPKKE